MNAARAFTPSISKAAGAYGCNVRQQQNRWRCVPRRALPISKDNNCSDGDGDGAVQLLTKSSAGHKPANVKACEMVGNPLRANTRKVRKDHVAVRRAIVLAMDKLGIELSLGTAQACGKLSESAPRPLGVGESSKYSEAANNSCVNLDVELRLLNAETSLAHPKWFRFDFVVALFVTLPSPSPPLPGRHLYSPPASKSP
jgi:hypothetical protein